jgi:hypothetical protein
MSRQVFTDIPVGRKITITVTWTNTAGVTKDSVTTAWLKDPDGTVTAPTVTHVGVTDSGQYTITFKVTKSRVYYGALITDDVITDAEDFEVRVNTTPRYP